MDEKEIQELIEKLGSEVIQEKMNAAQTLAKAIADESTRDITINTFKGFLTTDKRYFIRCEAILILKDAVALGTFTGNVVVPFFADFLDRDKVPSDLRIVDLALQALIHAEQKFDISIAIPKIVKWLSVIGPWDYETDTSPSLNSYLVLDHFVDQKKENAILVLDEINKSRADKNILEVRVLTKKCEEILKKRNFISKDGMFMVDIELTDTSSGNDVIFTVKSTVTNLYNESLYVLIELPFIAHVKSDDDETKIRYKGPIPERMAIRQDEFYEISPKSKIGSSKDIKVGYSNYEFPPGRSDYTLTFTIGFLYYVGTNNYPDEPYKQFLIESSRFFLYGF